MSTASSIANPFSRLLGGCRRIFRKVASDLERQPPLPDYDKSCADLGGVPWRRFDHTEKWFVGDVSTQALDSISIPTLDSISIPALDPISIPALDPIMPTVAVDSAPIAINANDVFAPGSLKPRMSRSVIFGAGGLLAFCLLAAIIGSHKSPLPAPIVFAAPSAPTVAAAIPQPLTPPVIAAKPMKSKKPRPHHVKHRAG